MIDKFVGLAENGSALMDAQHRGIGINGLEGMTLHIKKSRLEDEGQTPDRAYAKAALAEVEAGIAAVDAYHKNSESPYVLAQLKAGKQAMGEFHTPRRPAYGSPRLGL